MPRINVKLDEVTGGGFATFPDGTYKVALLASSSLKKSKESGAGYIRWISKCVEGEMEGKLISWNTSLLEDALWNLKNLLEVIDFEWEEEGFDLEEVTEDEPELLIDVSTYHWKDDPPEVMRNNVDGYHAV